MCSSSSSSNRSSSSSSSRVVVVVVVVVVVAPSKKHPHGRVPLSRGRPHAVAFPHPVRGHGRFPKFHRVFWAETLAH